MGEKDSANTQKQRMGCLRCGAAMRYMPVRGGFYMQCPRCEAIWIDSPSLDAVTGWPSRLTSDRHVPGAPGKFTCPECSVNLMVVDLLRKKGGPGLDICPSCRGVWFGNGDLDRFVEVCLRGDRPAVLEQDLGVMSEKGLLGTFLREYGILFLALVFLMFFLFMKWMETLPDNPLR